MMLPSLENSRFGECHTRSCKYRRRRFSFSESPHATFLKVVFKGKIPLAPSHHT
jgi:hypothetical protein